MPSVFQMIVSRLPTASASRSRMASMASSVAPVRSSSSAWSIAPARSSRLLAVYSPAPWSYAWRAAPDGLREARVVGVSFGGQGGLPFLALDLAGGGALAHDLAVLEGGFAPCDLVFGPVGQADVLHGRLVVVLQRERAPVGCLPYAVLQGERGAVAQRGRRARGPGGGHVDGGVAVLRFGGQDAGSRGHAEVGMLLGRVGEGQRDGGAVGSLHAGIVGALVERGQGLSVGQGERAPCRRP